jgi:hypothetical protein
MSISLLFVGYKTCTIPDVEKFTPEFKAPAHWKDKAKIEAAVTEKREAFQAEAHLQPYTGTFDEVVLIDAKNQKSLRYVRGAADEGKSPVSVRVRNYLLKTYPDAWGNDPCEVKKPSVTFVGFDPRLFLKVLGLECSLPSVGKPVPLRLWYNNSDHRDITEAVLPKDYKNLDLKTVLKLRRPVEPEAIVKWDALVKDWDGPGKDPAKDAQLSVELALQLGLL